VYFIEKELVNMGNQPMAKVKVGSVEVAEKVILSRLLKNAQMQGTRNPEEWGVLGRTPQQTCPVLDTGKNEGNAADGRFSAACYKSGERWKYTNSFRLRDIKDIITALEKVHPVKKVGLWPRF
jgi:hypothetical protein